MKKIDVLDLISDGLKKGLWGVLYLAAALIILCNWL